MNGKTKTLAARAVLLAAALLVTSGCGYRQAPAAEIPPTHTRTPVPAHTSTSTPTPEAATPTSAPSPTPTHTPTPMPSLRRLTGGGCCTQPFWSPESRRVLFIDKPGANAPTGIWGVDVTLPDPTPELFTRRIAFYTDDFSFIVETGGEETVIERVSDGKRWEVPALGFPVSLSPDGERIAWQVSDEDVTFERRTTDLWVSDLDGSDARLVTTLRRGSLGGWVSDDVLLLSGRESLDSREQVMYTLSLTSGQKTELARSERLRGGVLSPGGGWLAYYVALDEDRSKNGLWLVSTDGQNRHLLDRELFGAYRWRDEGRLLIIPFHPDAPVHELWELEVETMEAHRLTDPVTTPFKVANGDWTVSPDGRYVAFVESRDRNIWLLDLGD